jgi:hypothetical protein
MPNSFSLPSNTMIILLKNVKTAPLKVTQDLELISFIQNEVSFKIEKQMKNYLTYKLKKKRGRSFE